MKKFICVFVSLLMLFGICGISAFAEGTGASAKVYVTIADGDGKLVLTQEEITVTDRNDDGILTIDEALFATHEAKYEGGAAAGYGSAVSSWGLSLTKLWGVENGGSYGYYVNNASAMGLGDEVKEGDYINAFIYTDLTTWSDKYTFFNKNTLTAHEDEEISLTLSAAGYDASYNPITTPVEGATITLNGVATNIKTNAEGKATVKLADAGKVVISAASDTAILVPPVCVATVASKKSVNAYVTVANAGKLVLTQEKIKVTDVDKDGYLTVNDALYNAHEERFEGGAAVGYGSAYTEYGLSLTKFWGDTSGSFGYYVNNKSSLSLADEVKDGDYITAFIYTDTTAYSDKYSFFDKNTLTVTADEEITLTLSAAGYDASYNPITVPVKDATITVNGEATEYNTDENGKVTMKLSKAGTYVISATSTTDTLVPPVLTVTVKAKTPVTSTPESGTIETITPETSATDTINNEEMKSPKTGDNSNTDFYIMLLAVSAMGIVFSTRTLKRKTNEK